MVARWYRSADELLGRLERAGWPWLAVVAVAYLVGFEIAAWLHERR